jgi:intracellular sulfur oxidation DsrE/DsrF family protein
MSAFASLAGIATVDAAVSTTAAAVQGAQASPASTPGWDLRFLDEFRGAHKQLYDLGSFNLGADQAPLRYTRNFLDTFRDVYTLDSANINTIVGVSGPAFALNASDRLWEKYALGERSKIVDPTTMKPAVRNILLEGSPISVTALQARGTVFWQCNIAIGVIAQQLADARRLPVAEVRADLVAGLNPGVRLVPSHVMALALAQERGFTYMKP